LVCGAGRDYVRGWLQGRTGAVRTRGEVQGGRDVRRGVDRGPIQLRAGRGVIKISRHTLTTRRRRRRRRSLAVSVGLAAAGGQHWAVGGGADAGGRSLSTSRADAGGWGLAVSAASSTGADASGRGLALSRADARGWGLDICAKALLTASELLAPVPAPQPPSPPAPPPPLILPPLSHWSPIP
jgi:hypothetical protein